MYHIKAIPITIYGNATEIINFTKSFLLFFIFSINNFNKYGTINNDASKSVGLHATDNAKHVQPKNIFKYFVLFNSEDLIIK